MSRADSSPAVFVVGPIPPPFTGRAIVTRELIAAIERCGPRCELLNIALGRSGIGQLVKACRYLRAVVRILGEGGRSAVVTASSDGPWAYADAIVIAAARIRRLQIHVHHHNWGVVADPPFSMRVVSRLAGTGARHIALCSAMADLLVKSGVARSKPLLLTNALFVTGASTKGGASGGSDGGSQSLRLGMLGNLTAEKGLMDAIEVLERLLGRGIDVELVLAGPILGSDMQAAVADAASRTSAITAIGAVDDEGRNAFLQRCDIMLFPSAYRNEAQPMVVFEALSRGCPVLGTRIGCVGDLLGPAGWALPAGRNFADWAADLIPSVAAAANEASHTAYGLYETELATGWDELDQVTASFYPR